MAKHKRKAPEYIGSDFSGSTKYYQDGNAIFASGPLGAEYSVMDDQGVPGQTFIPDLMDEDDLQDLLAYEYMDPSYHRRTADDPDKKLGPGEKAIFPSFEYIDRNGVDLLMDYAGNRAFDFERGLFADVDPKTSELGPFYSPVTSLNVKSPLSVDLKSGEKGTLTYNPVLKEYVLSTKDRGKFSFGPKRGLRWRAPGKEDDAFDSAREMPPGLINSILNLFAKKKYRRFEADGQYDPYPMGRNFSLVNKLEQMYADDRMPLWEVNGDGNITDTETGSRYGMKDGRLVKLSRYCKAVQYNRKIQ